MIPVGWLLLVVLLGLLGLYLRGLIGRLDRLHLRVELTSEALDAQLLRRSSAVRALGESGVLDPASSLLLLDAAAHAQQADDDERPLAESALSQALRTVIEQPGTVEVLTESEGVRVAVSDLARAGERVVLARGFANEAVRSTWAVRQRPLVRLLRLAGHAPMPVMFDMDDAPPQQLARYVSQSPYP